MTGTLAASVPLSRCEPLRLELRRLGLLDTTRRVHVAGDRVILPAKSLEGVALAAHGAVAVTAESPAKPLPKPPLESIRETALLPPALKEALPRRWEKIGDVVLLRLPDALRGHAAAVAEAYGAVLGAKTVAEYGAIRGEYREPSVTVLWGNGTETEHRENGLRYRLDVARVMFSSGNLPERVRMGKVVRPGGVVVDLFAGIGYYALPMAVHGGATVYACEINPTAFRFLQENARINRADRLIPVLGDCREVAPRGIADRVVLGYLDGADFLPTAMECLHDAGWVHYHEACPEELAETRPLERVTDASGHAGMRVTEHRLRYLKSYAPGVWHVVLDARVGR